MAAERSDLPFPDALRQLMADADVSFRKLAIKTQLHRKGGYTSGYLNHLAVGHTRPTPETIEVISAALGEQPEYFVEYRQHRAAERAAELTVLVGLDAVLDALDSVSSTPAVAARARRAAQRLDDTPSISRRTRRAVDGER